MTQKNRIALLSLALISLLAIAGCRRGEPTVPLIGGPITVTPPPSEAIVVETIEVPTQTPVPVMTKILIDGRSDDWTDYPILVTDWDGDQEKGDFDIKSVRAFTNQSTFYFLLDSFDPDVGEYVQIELDLDVNRDGIADYTLILKPRSGRIDLLDLYSRLEVAIMDGGLSEREAVELKIPLDHLGASDQLILSEIRVMGGICCMGDWYVIDHLGPAPVFQVYQVEMELPELYDLWISSPPTGFASLPFVVNDADFDGPRAIDLTKDETAAYVVDWYAGEVSRVNIDPASPSFGQVEVIKDDLFVLYDVDLHPDETVAYLIRVPMAGYSQSGSDVVSRLHLETAQIITVISDLKQPTSFVLSDDGDLGFLVDVESGELYEVNPRTSIKTLIAEGLDRPFGLAIDFQRMLAYIVTIPGRAGDYPLGDLLKLNLQTGKLEIIAPASIQGATNLTLAGGDRIVIVAEYGHKGVCDGRLSAFNVDVLSPQFGEKTIVLDSLCGPHDVKLNKDETLAYIVEVDGSRFSLVQINIGDLY